jgi:hypothetical protein
MAEPSEFNVADARDKLRKLDAFFYDNLENTDQVMLGDSEINLAWKVSAPDQVPHLRWFLENYTWDSNTVECKYVDDPIVKGSAVLGRWRQAYVRDLKKNEKGQDIYYIILTLRKGYIESLVTASVLDYSEARVDQVRQLPAGTCTTNPGGTTASDFVILKWNNISPYKVETIKDQIEALAPDTFSPVIRGESYGTNMHRLYISSSIETDGSATINLLLASPEFTLTGFQTWQTNKQTNITYHWDVPRTIAQALINTEQGRGKSVIPSYNPTQGLVDIVVYTKDFTTSSVTGITLVDMCDYSITGNLYWGVYDPNNAAYACPAYSSGLTYFKDVSNNDDGTYDISIRVRKARYRNYPLRQSMESVMLERWEHLQLNVSDESVPDISSATRGYIYRQSRNPNEDCSSNYDTSYDRGILFVMGREAVLSSAANNQYQGISKNNADTVKVSEQEPSYIYRVDNSVNEYGLYDSVEQVIMSKEMQAYARFMTRTGAYGWIRPFRNLKQSTLHSLIEALPPDPSISISINDDFTYSGQLAYDPSRSASSGESFVGSDAHWESNDFKYDTASGKKYKITCTQYRKFFWARGDAASAMDTHYGNDDKNLPALKHGLWEAVWTSEPVVTEIT